jgi:hypothetical protein
MGLLYVSSNELENVGNIIPVDLNFLGNKNVTTTDKMIVTVIAVRYVLK